MLIPIAKSTRKFKVYNTKTNTVSMMKPSELKDSTEEVYGLSIKNIRGTKASNILDLDDFKDKLDKVNNDGLLSERDFNNLYVLAEVAPDLSTFKIIGASGKILIATRYQMIEYLKHKKVLGISYNEEYGMFDIKNSYMFEINRTIYSDISDYDECIKEIGQQMLSKYESRPPKNNIKYL